MHMTDSIEIRDLHFSYSDGHTALRGVSLTVIEVAGRVRAFLSPMSRLQERLLELLGGSTDLYERVVEYFQEPALNLSER